MITFEQLKHKLKAIDQLNYMGSMYINLNQLPDLVGTQYSTIKKLLDDIKPEHYTLLKRNKKFYYLLDEAFIDIIYTYYIYKLTKNKIESLKN